MIAIFEIQGPLPCSIYDLSSVLHHPFLQPLREILRQAEGKRRTDARGDIVCNFSNYQRARSSISSRSRP